MIVLCLEGCHGSGKTELVEQFKRDNYTVLDEAFIDMPHFALHPQCLVMEFNWVASWFQNVLKQHRTLQGKYTSEELKSVVLIADRSPFSACFYSKEGGDTLDPVIRTMIEQLKTQIDIHIHTIHLSVDRELLWSRILKRLEKEPERKDYNEDSREWMEDTLKFYESQEWDYTVQNNNISITQLKENLLSQLKADLPYFPARPVRTPSQMHLLGIGEQPDHIPAPLLA